MRIAENKELKLLAESCKKSKNEVSDIIVSELIGKNIIEEREDNLGCRVSDCYKRDITISEMVEIARNLGIENVRSEHIDAIYGCVLLGDGECPVCGGKMEDFDSEWEQVSGGYEVPPVYECVREDKKCKHCGERIFDY